MPKLDQEQQQAQTTNNSLARKRIPQWGRGKKKGKKVFFDWGSSYTGLANPANWKKGLFDWNSSIVSQGNLISVKCSVEVKFDFVAFER